MNARKAIAAVCLVVWALAPAGCRTVEPAEPLRPREPLEVKIAEGERVKIVDPGEAFGLKMQERLRAAHGLRKAGKRKEALEVLNEIAALAREEEIELPGPIREQIRLALAETKSASAPAAPAVKVEPPAPRAAAPPVPRAASTPAAPPPVPAPPVEPAPRAAAAPKAAPAAPGDEGLVSVNFIQVDWAVFLKTMSQLTGRNFIPDEKVTGTVTVIASKKIRPDPDQFYAVLEYVLDVKGLAAVPMPEADMIKIVQRQDALKRNVQVRVGKDPGEIPETDSIVTQLIPLEHVQAADIATLLGPSIPSGSHLAVHEKTNTLMLTDTSSNIHRLAKIIQQLDVPGARMDVTVIALEHASAQELSDHITDIMAKGGGARRLPAGRPRGSRPVARTTPVEALKILPDDRTNSLIVVANARDTETIRQLVERLDVERPLGMGRVHVIYLQHADAESMAKSLTAALAKISTGARTRQDTVKVTADKSTQALIITASPQEYQAIQEIIAKLDIARDQLLVEMQIVEISRDKTDELGIEWATLDRAGDHLRGFAGTDFGVRVESLSGALEGFALGAFKKGPGGVAQIGAMLRAYAKDSDVNILSTPHILASNNEEAEIVIAENIPYVKESRITETDVESPTLIKTYDYKDVGIRLTITPHINPNRTVRLKIESEISKLIESALGAGMDTPTTAKRTVKTTVSVQDGRTIVIGGLIRDDKSNVTEKVPYLGDLPWLGRLFRSTKDTVQKTNLLLFITPHVVTAPEEIEKTTARKREESPEAADLLKK